MVNIILFIAVFLAALILVTWYIQSVRPTRYIIGAVSEDIEELRQHLSNACVVTIYNASYLLATETTGQIITNETHYCIVTEVFGSCRVAPCQLGENRLQIGQEHQLLTIDKGDGDQVRVTLRT